MTTTKQRVQELLDTRDWTDLEHAKGATYLVTRRPNPLPALGVSSSGAPVADFLELKTRVAALLEAGHTIASSSTDENNRVLVVLELEATP